MSFLSYLISGISLGSIYAIIALGYTMVYGIARMLNFAHGDIIMVGGFAIFTMVSTLGMAPMVGILTAVAVCTVLGVTIEFVAYRPLRGASSLAVLITAIGVSYLLQNVALLIFGSNARQFTSVVTVPGIKLAGPSVEHPDIRSYSLTGFSGGRIPHHLEVWTRYPENVPFTGESVEVWPAVSGS